MSVTIAWILGLLLVIVTMSKAKLRVEAESSVKIAEKDKQLLLKDIAVLKSAKEEIQRAKAELKEARLLLHNHNVFITNNRECLLRNATVDVFSGDKKLIGSMGNLSVAEAKAIHNYSQKYSNVDVAAIVREEEVRKRNLHKEIDNLLKENGLKDQ